MVEIEIYPACLTCDCPAFEVSTQDFSHRYADGSQSTTNQKMSCRHAVVCNKIQCKGLLDLEDLLQQIKKDHEYQNFVREASKKAFEAFRAVDGTERSDAL